VSVILIYSDRFADHQTPPGHPERAERAEVMEVVAKRWQARGTEVVAPRVATKEQLSRVHDAQYIRLIEETAGQAVALDPDTYTSPESYEVALLAAGAAVEAVERVLGGAHRSAVALVRPPGHHAERDRAMGFCLYNSIAVGAAHARAHGVGKVAIIDYDVHHGNGTQHMFESDPHVLYISTHQYPYYPGTGSADEVGRGAGKGFTVNVPIEVGAVDEDYHAVFTEIVVPVLTQFEPDLLMISAGFDAHGRDPLAGMRLTTDAFAAMTQELRRVAEDCCRGRIVALTEGGYDLEALAASLDATIETLSEADAEPHWPTSGIASTRGRDAVDVVRQALRACWAV
jgi:acetoin utilization deacetylase AcuC-like enzyme